MVMIDIPYIYFLFSNRLNVIFTKFDEVQKSGTMIQSANGEWGTSLHFCIFSCLAIMLLLFLNGY